MIGAFLTVLIALSLATYAWWRLNRKKDDGRVRFTPPSEANARENAVYMGEIQPRQREMVLAAYRYLTGEQAPDTRPLGYQEILPDGTIRGWSSGQLGPILPLSMSLCAGCRSLGYTQLLASVQEEILAVLPPEHAETALARLQDLPADHAEAVSRMTGNPEYLNLVYGLGDIPSQKPYLKTYHRKQG